MNEKEYNKTLGKILSGKGLNEDEANSFVEIVGRMESMLEDTDQEDFFSTEGWRHIMGWD